MFFKRFELILLSSEMTKNKRKHEAGNVLFLILIAVALFAALSYAVTQSSRGDGNDISDEQAKLIAGEILNYEVAIKTAAQRIKARGDWCEPYSVVPTELTDYSASCGNTLKGMVFEPEGGAIDPLLFDFDPDPAENVLPEYYHLSYYTGAVNLPIYQHGDAGAAVAIGVRDEKVCAHLNNHVFGLKTVDTGSSPTLMLSLGAGSARALMHCIVGTNSDCNTEWIAGCGPTAQTGSAAPYAANYIYFFNISDYPP